MREVPLCGGGALSRLVTNFGWRAKEVWGDEEFFIWHTTGLLSDGFLQQRGRNCLDEMGEAVGKGITQRMEASEGK